MKPALILSTRCPGLPPTTGPFQQARFRKFHDWFRVFSYPQSAMQVACLT